MAIDSSAKRKRALESGYGWGLPFPDGTIGDTDRAWLLSLYFGVEAEAPVTSGTTLNYTLPTSRLEYTLKPRRMEYSVAGRMEYTLKRDDR